MKVPVWHEELTTRTAPEITAESRLVVNSNFSGTLVEGEKRDAVTNQKRLITDFLRRMGPSTIQQLNDEISAPKGSVQQTLYRLERQGTVRRASRYGQQLKWILK